MADPRGRSTRRREPRSSPQLHPTLAHMLSARRTPPPAWSRRQGQRARVRRERGQRALAAPASLREWEDWTPGAPCTGFWARTRRRTWLAGVPLR